VKCAAAGEGSLAAGQRDLEESLALDREVERVAAAPGITMFW
jgi:hypothetical protein